MCGIAGVYFFKNKASGRIDHSKVLSAIRHRGPDNEAYSENENCVLYHSRLSIVDVSACSNQPYSRHPDSALVFNGEIFNYRDFNKAAHGDVEVLYQILDSEGEASLNKLNGFFAFAFLKQGKLLVARDRLGIKPLYYFKDDEKFAFASELKALLTITGKQKLNYSQIYSYFRLNYCSGPETIFENVFRLMPGQYLSVSETQFEIQNWYKPAKKANTESLEQLLEDSVKLRLHADVPVGTFLSGGIDSSIISALAKKHKPDLQTFSIGFKDESFFDETSFAESVATHIKSAHQTFKLSEDDFLNNIDDFLKCVDEPFADSSAFNFYMLCKYTSKKVKVALSGDGADELFKGYHKHRAMLLKRDKTFHAFSILSKPILAMAGASRNSKAGNLKRQLEKFERIKKLPDGEAYKVLASISTDEELSALLKKSNPDYFHSLFKLHDTKFDWQTLLDLKIVLADDMLVKADRFSMCNAMEIRNPFLDYRVVEYALNLPMHEKINNKEQKIILRKNFSHLLPPEIFTRRKKGFELPLQKWLSSALQNRIKNEWLNPEKLQAENLLNFQHVTTLNEEMCSENPGDSAAKLWAVIVFESWLDNYKDYIH